MNIPTLTQQESDTLTRIDTPNWILQTEVLEFGFYPLTFGGVWILHPDVLEFGFYPLNFKGVEVLLP